jgi:hypothetical protein
MKAVSMLRSGLGIHVFFHAFPHRSSKKPPEEGDGWNKKILVAIGQSTIEEGYITSIEKGCNCKYEPKALNDQCCFVHQCCLFFRRRINLQLVEEFDI